MQISSNCHSLDKGGEHTRIHSAARVTLYLCRTVFYTTLIRASKSTLLNPIFSKQSLDCNPRGYTQTTALCSRGWLTGWLADTIEFWMQSQFCFLLCLMHRECIRPSSHKVTGKSEITLSPRSQHRDTAPLSCRVYEQDFR